MMTRAYTYEFQSSNDSRYEEEIEWNVTQGKYNHIKKEAQTVISTIQESLTKLSCIHFVIQKQICSPKFFFPDGFQPPSLKKDANLYIK